MKRPHIIAHRGWWSHQSEQNTQSAIVGALERGYSVEIDLRDHQGELVISHDVPTKPTLTWQALCQALMITKTDGAIFINIKSDGLCRLLPKDLCHTMTHKLYFFDGAIPDLIHYVRSGLPYLARLSDYEPIACLAEQAQGLWIDTLGDQEPSVDQIKVNCQSHHCLCWVSSELHGQEPLLQWQQLRQAYIDGLYRGHDCYLCTDLPQAAHTFFNLES